MTAIAAWRIRPRLILAFVGVLLPYAALAGVGMVGIRLVMDDVQAIYSEAVVEQKGVRDVERALDDLAFAVVEMYATRGDPAERAELEQRVVRFQAALAGLSPASFHDPRERRLVERLGAEGPRLAERGREVASAWGAGAGQERAGGEIAGLDRAVGDIRIMLNQLQAIGLEEMGSEVREATGVIRRVIVWGLVAIALSIAGGIGLALVFSAWISRPIRALEAGSREMAQGNLSHRIAPTAGGELGEVTRAFNEMAGELQGTRQALADRVRALEEALAEVKQLREILPICSYCKKIRDDQQYWQQLDAYIGRELDVRFSHGVCPECREKIVKPQLEQIRREAKERS